jgi:hypothetical protein
MYGDHRLLTFYVTDEFNFSRTQLTNQSLRTLARYSTTPKVHGTYASINSGLQKLSEIDAPVAQKMSIEPLSYKGYKAIVLHYQKNKEHHGQVLISSFLTNSKSIDAKLEEDTTGTVYLTDWFESSSSIMFKGYVSEQSALPIKLALINREGHIVQTQTLSNAKKDIFFSRKKNRLAVNEKSKSLFELSSEQEVRVILLQDKSSFPVHAATMLVPVEQEFRTSGEIDEFSEDIVQVPEQKAILTTYPNPFNPSTTISVKIEQQSNIQIKIFDVTGKLVRELANEQKVAGNYAYTFDAGHLASGVYLVRVQLVGADGTKTLKTQQITLIK